MAKQVQWRRGTATQNNAFTGADGEVTVDSTNKSLRVHDGAAAGGFETARKTVVDSHIANTANPHSVTKTQVGLGNVDNTSDLSKPISTATQTALNGKATTAQGAKADTALQPGTSIDNIAESATHKKMTAAERTKLAGVATGATANATDATLLARANHTGTQAISTVLGLQTALDSKAPTASPAFTGTVSGVTKAMVGLGSVDNTADADKPISTATQTALDGKAPIEQGVIPINAGATAGTGAAYTATAVIMPAAGQSLNFTPHVDSTVTQPTLAITAEGDTQTRPLRGADNKPFSDPIIAGTVYTIQWGNSISRVIGKIAVVDETPASGVSEYAPVRTLQGLAVPNTYGSRFAAVVSGGANAYQLQPVYTQAMLQTSGTATVIDCSHVIAGSSVTMYLRAGDKVIAGNGRTFIGRAGGMATASAASVVRVIVISVNLIAIEEISGTAPTYAASDAISYAHSIARGGQSNALRAHSFGGIGGFTRGARASGWLDTAVTASIKWIDGATGGTAIDKRSVADGATNYWWDAVLGETGPALDTFMSEVADAVSAGAPIPAVTLWTQGESDASALISGALTVAQMTETIRDVWLYIRATYPSMKFIVNMIGSHDNRALDRGANAARVAYLDAIDAEVFATQGVELYDLPRSEGEIHYLEMGYAILGAREARAWSNVVLAQDNTLGPQVTSALLSDGGNTVTLTVDWGGPAYVQEPLEIFADQPFGIYALAAGDDASEAPVPFTSGRISGSTIVLTSEVDLTGGRVGGPWGYAANVRFGRTIRDYQYDSVHDWPGQPLRSFIMDLA